MDIPEGKVVALMGRNGVGKSTLLKTVMGLIRPLSGTIVHDRKDITHWKPEARPSAGIGYVPQGREIFPYLTVQENLVVGLEARGKKGIVPDGIFDLFPGLKDLQNRKGGDLSGGQQQQLAIARVLITEPEAPSPRRAHRGHPAVHRLRDREYDTLHKGTGKPDRSSSWSNTSILP